MTKTARVKNEQGKMRDVNNPYEVWVCEVIKWYWRVLKKWQANDNKPYARWFCAVKSPNTFGSYDMGDVYVSEIKGTARKLTEQEMIQHLQDNKW